MDESEYVPLTPQEVAAIRERNRQQRIVVNAEAAERRSIRHAKLDRLRELTDWWPYGWQATQAWVRAWFYEMVDEPDWDPDEVFDFIWAASQVIGPEDDDGDRD